MKDGKNYFDENPNLTPVEWLGIREDEIIEKGECHINYN